MLCSRSDVNPALQIREVMWDMKHVSVAAFVTGIFHIPETHHQLILDQRIRF